MLSVSILRTMDIQSGYKEEFSMWFKQILHEYGNPCLVLKGMANVSLMVQTSAVSKKRLYTCLVVGTGQQVPSIITSTKTWKDFRPCKRPGSEVH